MKISTRGMLKAGLAAVLFSVATVAGAQDWNSGDNANERDHVTGYLCVTPACDTLRLPNSNCICTKNNPAEMRLSRLKLTCTTRKGGEWVACPVKPRYGN